MVSNFPALQQLYVRFNSMTGSLAHFSNLSKLEILVASHNSFTGSVEYLTGCSSLRTVDLSHNQFVGEFDALLALTNAVRISLNQNRLLAESVPRFLKGLSALPSMLLLNLSFNEMDFPGALPAFLQPQDSRAFILDVRGNR